MQEQQKQQTSDTEKRKRRRSISTTIILDSTASDVGKGAPSSPRKQKAAHKMKKTSPPKAIVFVIHGMGPQTHYPRNLKDLRETCNVVLKEEFGHAKGKEENSTDKLFREENEGGSATRASSASPSSFTKGEHLDEKVSEKENDGEEDDEDTVMWIPIEWHKALHLSSITPSNSLSETDLPSVSTRISQITLPSLPRVRGVVNDVLSDGFYYFGSFHGQRILNVVAKALDEGWREVLDKFGEVNCGGIKVAIVGHSLGSVISYDLLAHQLSSPDIKSQEEKASSSHHSHRHHHHRPIHQEILYPQLSFKVSYLFALGSPFGAVVVQRGQNLRTYTLPPYIKFFNLFNLYDPIAYRLEPLLHEKYSEISPVLIVRPSGSGGKGGLGNEFSYYKEMIYAFLPDLRGIIGGVGIPNFRDFEMPTLPAVPDLGIAASMKEMGASVPKINLPTSLLDVMSRVATGSPAQSSNPLSTPAEKVEPTPDAQDIFAGPLPHIPILAEAQAAFQAQVNKLLAVFRPSNVATEEIDDDVEEGRVEGSGGKWHHLGQGIGRPMKKPKHEQEEEVKTISSPKPATTMNTRVIKKAVSKIQKHHLNDEHQNTSKSTLEPKPTGRSDESTPSSPTNSSRLMQAAANQRVFSYIAKFFSFQEADESIIAPSNGLPGSSTSNHGDASSNRKEKPSSPKKMKNQIEIESSLTSNANNLGENLTKELIAAAHAAEKHIEQEKKLRVDPTTHHDNLNEKEKDAHLGERLDFFVNEKTLDSTYHQYMLGMTSHFSYWKDKDIMFKILSSMKVKE